MKRVILASIVASALVSHVAIAADLAVTPAPAAPLASTWTGFYIGVHGGAGWESTSNWSAIDQNFPVRGFAPQTLSGNPGLGGVGGFQGGYNWQFGPAWLIGVEGDFSWASLGDTRTMRASTVLSAGPTVAISMSDTKQWLASARGRIGYVGWGNGLYYLTGGAAWANVEYTGNATNIATTSRMFGDTFGLSMNSIKSGLVLGGGAEYQVTSNILLRWEYLCYRFSGFTASQSETLQTFTWNSFNVQVARVAASYKF